MLLTKALRRLAATCALVLAGVVVTASPAAADEVPVNISPAGASAPFWVYLDGSISLHLLGCSPTFYIPWCVGGSARFDISHAFNTSATDCDATIWLTLSDGTTTWDSPHWTNPPSACAVALTCRDCEVGYATTPTFNTVADRIKVHVCVHLKWDNGALVTIGCAVSPNWIYG
jgi:hypothetical protein